jgi:DNA-binding NarL/FixJ family response regulator
MIPVLMVDDHQVVREGLRQVVRQGPELYMVCEAVDGTEAIVKVRQLYPDVVLMDLVLPKLDGLAATAIIRQEMPGTHVLVLANGLGVGTSVMEALHSEANSYLLKDVSASELCLAIRVVARGPGYLPKMYGKLGVQSRAQAILTTMRLSLVSSEASFTKGTHFLPSRRPGVLERKEKR